MAGSNLVDSPCPFSYAVAAPKIQVLDNIFNANSKPASLVARLFLYSYSKLVVEFCQRFIEQSNRI